MSIEKAIVRTSVLNEIGTKADDFLEAYKNELQQLEGALQGIARSQAAVEGLLLQVDKDIDSPTGKLGLENGKVAKDWLVRASQTIQALRTGTQNNVLVARGKIEATQQQISFLKKAYDVEKARLESYAQAETAPPSPHDNVIPIGPSTPNENGSRDNREGPISLKTRRIRESMAANTPKKKKAAKDPTVPPPSSVASLEPTKEPNL